MADDDTKTDSETKNDGETKTIPVAKKNSLFDAYKTDANLEEEGAWVEMRGGAQVKVRSENSTAAREYAAKLTKVQRQILQANNWVLPPKMQDRNEVLTCRHAIVVDWKNVPDEEGNDLPYSPAAVERILTALPRFRADILQAAKLEETFKPEMAGN